jgi:uncharacterized protein
MIMIINEMKSSSLPKNINPVQLAAQNQQIQGRLSLMQCERLLPVLVENTGYVDFSLQFMQDDEQRTVVRVNLSVELVLECRRCLKSMTYPVKTSQDLVQVSDDQAATLLPEYYEPLIVNNDEVELISLIEDELLLNLPVMPSHSDVECTAALPIIQDDTEPKVHMSPFAVLKPLFEE